MACLLGIQHQMQAVWLCKPYVFMDAPDTTAFRHPFNLHPDEWFEGFPVNSTQFFYWVPPEIFLGTF